MSGLGRLGHVGVLIFFALSGYLITDRLLAEYRSAGTISLRNFYLRRAFRILPPAVFFLGVVAALNVAGVTFCSWAAIRAALLFYINYCDFGAAGWKVGHFWSLSVEEHFYLVWPCLLIGLGILQGWRTAAIVAAALCIWRPLDNHYHFIARLFQNPHLATDPYRTDMVADTLLWGCCLAFLLPIRAAREQIFSTIAALGAGAALVVLSIDDTSHVTPLVHFLPTLLLAAIVWVPRAPIGRFLEFAPLRYLGKLSYSLYVWQQLVVGEFILPIALIIILACAYLSYRFVEQPSIRFGRKLIRRWAA